MDTTIKIPSKFIEDFSSIQPAELTEDELNTIKNYIDITRDTQESKQLFDVFYFNLKSLLNNFTLYSGDTVKKSLNCPECSSESIAVNALVINLISSAKTFVEFLRATASRWFEKNEDDKDEFNIYVSDVYDKSIVYRILMHLRDYAQHGYLPVSFKEGRYSFDVSQILTTPHFNLNAKVKSDMEDFLSNFDPSEEVACLALTITIADFVVKVIDIYSKFLFCIKGTISSSYLKIQEMIKTNPNIICTTHKRFNGYIIFSDGNMYHTFDTKDNPNKMIDDYEKYVTDIYDDEKNEYDRLHSTTKKVSKKELK